MPHSRKTDLRNLAALLLAIKLVAAVALAGSSQGSVYLIAGVHMPVFALCALVALGLNWIMFVPSYLARTEHYFDLTGSLTFVTVLLTALMLSPSQDLRAVTLTVLICIWATRLGGFLFLRVRTDGGDGRFDVIKTDFLRFLLAWTLQGLWVVLSSAAALAAISSTSRVEMGPVAVIGIALWTSGFIIEVTADAQKRAFRADSRNQGNFISTGLWAWSRHPNYFGEITLWFGIALIALPALSGWQYLTLISPIFVALLITRVSGVPMLEARAEKRWGDDPAYRAYREQTPSLVPRPPSR